jgi:predicted ArsR family transcriptional regulator
MSSLDQALTGERTKYKAIVQHVHQTMWQGYHKDPSDALSEEKVASLAAILKQSAYTPTRNDRRFPNQNQVNNCWCVAIFTMVCARICATTLSLSAKLIHLSHLQDCLQRVPIMRGEAWPQ